MVLAKYDLNLNSTYVTYVLTGIIVVVAVLMDVIKTKNQNKVKKGVKIYHANGLIPDLGKEKNFKIYIPASAIEKI
jgi:hypothetical protein